MACVIALVVYVKQAEQTFHVSKSKMFSSQAVWGVIDVNNRFLSQRHPYHLADAWMVLFDKANDLVDCQFGRLPTGMNIGTRDISKVDGSSNEVQDTLGLRSDLSSAPTEHTLLIK